MVLGEDRIALVLHGDAVIAKPSHPDGTVQTCDDGVVMTVPIRLKHRDGALLLEALGGQLQAGQLDRALVRAVVLARTWAGRLASGELETMKNLAKDQGICPNYATRMLPLAWLAPDLIEMVLDGRQPRSMSLSKLIANPLPTSWTEQRRLFT